MDIVDHQHDATTMLGEFQQHPVDHRLPVEVRRRSWRLILDRAGSLTDGVEQGKPEKLRILLVMPHRHRSDAMRPIRAVCPGAQQRCLPAASRRRNDRHLPRCRVVETGDEIVASDHSGSVHVTFTSPWPACLSSTADSTVTVSRSRSPVAYARQQRRYWSTVDYRKCGAVGRCVERPPVPWLRTKSPAAASIFI